MKPVLDVENLSFSYGSPWFRQKPMNILEDISFDVRSGETLAVIGRNGSGKSTLLKLLAAIYQPTGGRIVRSQTSISLLSLQIGFLPNLSGRENMLLSALLIGKSKKWVQEHQHQILEFAELTNHVLKPVKAYSSGMRARLGFSIAYFANPDVILIDEVLGVGDVDFRKKSTEAMKERLKSDKTVVLVTHNLSTMRELCDRVVWIEEGRLVDIDTPDGIIPRYMEYGRTAV